MSPSPLRLGILASHAGTTMQAVIDGCASGAINAEISLVISNNSSSQALARAKRAGLTTAHLSKKIHANDQELDSAILAALTEAQVDLVLLCGYMKKLGRPTLNHFRGRLLNTHPSLLPKYGGQGYYGRKVHDAVIAAGDSASGVTLHQVAEGYDTGEIIEQQRVPVLPTDSAADLEERVKEAEQKLLVKELARMASEHLRQTETS